MSTVYKTSTDELHAWIRAEVELAGRPAEGSSGAAVRRVQEWLNLHDRGVVVDGDFGTATKQAVQDFQEARSLPETGAVDPETWKDLVRPMTEVLVKRLDSSYPDFALAIIEYAKAHLASHPREVGDRNRGPWVRLYMRGNQGNDWAWCAGFVTFLMTQAADSMEVPPPIEGSCRCDDLAKQAIDAGLFVEEEDADWERLHKGNVFLIQRAPGDWNHTGVVLRAGPTAFTTVEGNTNDTGGHEGYEVCRRTRSYTSTDFIKMCKEQHIPTEHGGDN
ncbi:peptidoglycan-binding domain-containing protein [Actinoplanes sp. NPDC049118]|uniref:peptidoglycan-binding domain-containing protein n=1 Tax=Actinoplanes sp. NPDC049118 TaxID=3155769 RepID=UPI0033C9B699